jgi:hypothetical protein
MMQQTSESIPYDATNTCILKKLKKSVGTGFRRDRALVEFIEELLLLHLCAGRTRSIFLSTHGEDISVDNFELTRNRYLWRFVVKIGVSPFSLSTRG